MSVYFKTLEKKTPIDPDKISEEICPSLQKQRVRKTWFEF